MTFDRLFTSPKPLIACIHLLPLPGSPRYAGNMQAVYDTALAEAMLFATYPIDALIVENFRDMPFYPGRLPAETVAALTAVTRDIVKAVPLPVGVNALRNDAQPPSPSPRLPWRSSSVSMSTSVQWYPIRAFCKVPVTTRYVCALPWAQRC